MWSLRKLLSSLRKPGHLTREQLLALRNPPHPANVPGPFYVEDGCCISCAVWEGKASDLLAWFEEEEEEEEGKRKSVHCYVAKQPETDAEFERMMSAMNASEVECIRVHNCRSDWAAHLIAAGHEMQIDPPEGPAKR